MLVFLDKAFSLAGFLQYGIGPAEVFSISQGIYDTQPYHTTLVLRH
jgi:hypothetical protein